MISSLEINLAMRRTFTNLYQKRETKAEASAYEGETKKESIAGRAPSPETGHRYGWNQAILARVIRYSTSTVRMGL
ncbi:hypothetical protein ARMSODRAFT_958521 [Armillaria solidipes]|uniref:Uncharacterized protein n=1 Tax=Armillaria solidipes TaxID=1076256 RepID=A0A2H3BLW2_9AGAR|nr:hypothetical protein ARMSODRAFT_958521 [Armillaria solidipes]